MGVEIPCRRIAGITECGAANYQARIAALQRSIAGKDHALDKALKRDIARRREVEELRAWQTKSREAFIDYYLEQDATLATDEAEALVDTRINCESAFECTICGSRPCQADWADHLMQMQEKDVEEEEARSALSRREE